MPRGGGTDGLVETELGERAPAGQLELGPHEVEAEHLLGDGVLDLQPGVGLEEDVAARVSASTRNSNVPRLS